MLNGNGEQVTHPQPSILLLEGVPQGDQARVVVQEPSDAVVTRKAAFEGPRIFVHATGMNGIWTRVSRAKMKKLDGGLFP